MARKKVNKKEVVGYDENVLYVCQKCAKDLGTAKNLKGTIYHEPRGGWYCEECYANNTKLKHR